MLTVEQSRALGARWRSGNHIAEKKPTQFVEFRTGRFKAGYAPWEGPPVGANVADPYIRQPGDEPPPGWPVTGYGQLYWQKTWTPDDGDAGVFAELKNVLDVETNQDFESNGITACTVAVENVAYPEVTGPIGAYWTIKRGYYSPYRGFRAIAGYPLEENEVAVEANEWFERFKHNGQLRIWQGYGDLIVPVFTGLIDVVDVESAPDRITITLRDFGQSLSDQRIFGWNKEPRIRDPLIFMDRLRADDVRKVGYEPRASSSHPDHPPQLAIDNDSATFWLSRSNDDRDEFEFIEIKLPGGRYTDFYAYPSQRGMDMYVALYANGGGTRNGEPIPEGWVDEGHGNVPGTAIPYIRRKDGLDAKGVYHALGAEFRLPQGSTLRIYLTSLARRIDGTFYASMRRLFANKRRLSDVASKRHYVLVDDVSDMVRTVLRWAGFKEWDVETAGVRLKERFVIARSKFYMDVIKAAQDQTGFVFYMKEPTTADDSIGIPCFRRPLVVEEPSRIPPRAFLRDTDLLTAIKTTDSDEPRAYIIRVRGRTAKEGEHSDIFQVLAGDRTKRLMYVYKPPWWRKLGGIVKHVVYTNNAFKTIDDCRAACYFIALQEALEAEKGTFSFPALPGWEADNGQRFGVELDSHAAVLDVGTGFAQRLYVTNRQSKFHSGEQASFTMTVSGAWVDTPDMTEVCKLIRENARSGEH
jgi:hypothetical protein